MSRLPDGWRIVPVRYVTESLKSGLSRKLSSEDIGLPVLRSNNLVHGGGINYRDIKYWYENDPQGAKTQNYVLRDEDILINFINSISAIGKCSIYKDVLKRDVIYTTNIMRLRVNRQIVLPLYFLYLTQTFDYDSYIQGITKLAVNQASFTNGDFSAWEFPLPPLAEQRKIAAILGTWDEAIALVQQLIAALQTRKKGLMHRLLTGEARFKEFEESEWEEKTLGQIVDLVNGKAFPPNDWVGEGLPIIRIRNLNGSKEFNYYDKEVDSKYFVETGALLFSWSGSRGTSFGPHIWQGQGGVLNQHIFRVEAKSQNVQQLFLYYQLMNIAREIEERAHGSAGLVRITKRELERFKVLLPSVDEQEIVSRVLRSEDNRIQLLFTYLNLLKDQKQGLVQRLLTGEIRVRVDEDANEAPHRSPPAAEPITLSQELVK